MRLVCRVFGHKWYRRSSLTKCCRCGERRTPEAAAASHSTTTTSSLDVERKKESVMADNGKTDVYRIVFVNETGNHQAICFQEPVEGKSFGKDEVWVLPGATAASTNDEGNIPHRETADYGPEGGGLTWHHQK